MSLRLLNLAAAALLCGTICNAQSPADSTRSHVPDPAAAVSGEAVIVLARGAGYWDMAPVYRLMIYSDGRVAYVGSKNVKTKGPAEGRIGRQDVQRLVKEFEKIDYFSLLDEYSEKNGCPFYLADGGNAHTSININGKKKAVFHDSGCLEDHKSISSLPRGLTELENLIDEIVKSDQWIK